jgi:hypothetical protein
MNKYINDDGKVGVLVSYGYGAGWSTWNGGGDACPNEVLVMDKVLVTMKLANDDEDTVANYCEMLTGKKPFMGGWSSTEVVWLDKGTKFRIDEHDGAEILITTADLPLEA